MRPTLFATLLLFACPALAEDVRPLKQPVGEIRGALVIGGTGALPDAVRDRFLELAGGKNAKLVVVPAPGAAANSVEMWQQRGVAAVTALPLNKRADADDMAVFKPLAEATGVWMDDAAPKALLAAYRDTALEKELRKVLERGGVIGSVGEGATVLGAFCIRGGNGAANVERGLGLLPGGTIEQALLEHNRVDRLLGALGRAPGHFGLGIEAQTAAVVRGRTVTVLGSGQVVTCLPGAGKKQASVQVLKGNDKADLIALSRGAVARSQAPFPPEKPQPPNVAKGALLIGGGGGLSEDIWKRFIELAGGPDELIVVIPTANEDPVPAEPGEAKALKRYGAKNLKVLHTRSRAEADKPEFAAPLREAKGVWFTGGRQWRFVDAYEGTATEKACHDLLARGGVIGGSSAGASIQTEYMPRGDPLGNLKIMAEGYERGFGFLTGVAVDQHFIARKRHQDMSELVATYPQLIGLGIDEGTVVIVRGSIMEVAGKSKVAVYDRRKPPVAGRPDYEELSPGTRFDLQSGKRVEAK